MSGSIESSGDIEIHCHLVGSTAGRSGTNLFETVGIGDRIEMVFNPNDGSNPPYSLKIFGPSGTNIVDSIVRDLPTGRAQSAPPIEFVVSARGVYRIEIREMKGRQRGEAKLTVR